MNKLFILCMLFVAATAFAQVGVGNTNPQAALDVTASNIAAPLPTDGILIPRIDEFPLTPPTLAQDGMMIYATGAGTVRRGFYYWDQNTTTWLVLGGAKAINELSDGRSDNDGSNNGSSIFLGINAGLNDDQADNQSIGIGFEALASSITGDDNIAIGYQSQESNISGFSNIGIGTETLFNNTANGNIAIGFRSLFTNSSASDNIAIGFSSLYANTMGAQNVGVGSQTLQNNTTGFFNNAFGRYALGGNTTGAGNTAVGHGAMLHNVIGNDNTVLGSGAGANINGSNNVYIGHNAGRPASLSTNFGNVAIGYLAGSGLNYNNQLFIDNSNTSNPLLWGDFATDILRINGTMQINVPGSGGYALPSSDGTAGQVLQTDGLGAVSWQNGGSSNTVALKLINSTSITSYAGFPTINTFTFDTELFNVGGGTYVPGTGTYTVPEDGIYQMISNISMLFSASPATDMIMIFRVYVNGAIADQTNLQNGALVSTSYAQTFPSNFHLSLNSGDTVQFRYLMTWGGSTPVPQIAGGIGSGTSTISLVKVN